MSSLMLMYFTIHVVVIILYIAVLWLFYALVRETRIKAIRTGIGQALIYLVAGLLLLGLPYVFLFMDLGEEPYRISIVAGGGALLVPEAQLLHLKIQHVRNQS